MLMLLVLGHIAPELLKQEGARTVKDEEANSALHLIIIDLASSH
jgi:hypothetical protein